MSIYVYMYKGLKAQKTIFPLNEHYVMLPGGYLLYHI